MNNDTIRLAIIIVASSLFGLWVITSFLVRLSGTWQRSDEPVDRERIRFTQFGPYVQGHAQIEGGGKRVYTGWIFFGKARLSRRDHGARALEIQGFPKEIAPLIEGQVSAKMIVHREQNELIARFVPHKISYTLQPPRITGTQVLASKSRVYSKLQGVHDALVNEV